MLIITGAGGMLGRHVAEECDRRDLDSCAYNHEELDITDAERVSAALATFDDGSVVINCAGLVPDVGASRSDMIAVNGQGPHNLARGSHPVIQVSTDCVFDGRHGPYTERTPVTLPTNGLHPEYASSKKHGELTQRPHLTVRTSFIGLGFRGLLSWILSQPEGGEIPGYVNWLWNGFHVRRLARVLVQLATHEPRPTGLLHLQGPITTKYQLVTFIARQLRPDLTVTAQYSGHARTMVLVSERMEGTIANVLAYTTWADLRDDLEKDQAIINEEPMPKERGML